MCRINFLKTPSDSHGIFRNYRKSVFNFRFVFAAGANRYLRFVRQTQTVNSQQNHAVRLQTETKNQFAEIRVVSHNYCFLINGDLQNLVIRRADSFPEPTKHQNPLISIFQ